LGASLKRRNEQLKEAGELVDGLERGIILRIVQTY
jgi:hypothetical protein